MYFSVGSMTCASNPRTRVEVVSLESYYEAGAGKIICTLPSASGQCPDTVRLVLFFGSDVGGKE